MNHDQKFHQGWGDLATNSDTGLGFPHLHQSPLWPNTNIFGPQISLWCQEIFRGGQLERAGCHEIFFLRKQQQIKDKAEVVDPGLPICLLTIRFRAVHANSLEEWVSTFGFSLIKVPQSSKLLPPPHLTPSLGQTWCLPSLHLIFPAANKGKQWLLPALMKSPVIHKWKIQCKCKECNYYYHQRSCLLTSELIYRFIIGLDQNGDEATRLNMPLHSCNAQSSPGGQ